MLAGKERAQSTMDAALFMTALRLACERGDPYFSLDPQDGEKWTSEGRQARNEFVKLADARVTPLGQRFLEPGGERVLPDPLSFLSFSARRDFPAFWHSVPAKYPNLRTELVFRPIWLKRTRFGEILYRADVLLKELATGQSLLGVQELRAAEVEHYASAASLRATRSLKNAVGEERQEADNEPSNGQRLWFDLVPHLASVGTADAVPGVAPRTKPRTPAALDLDKKLDALGFNYYFAGSAPPRIVYDHSAVDLSTVEPKMLVRRHDNTTGKDLPGSDPDYERVSHHLNARIERFAEVYVELRQLVDVFRAYVAAVAIVNRNNGVCRGVNYLELHDSEKVSQPLPDFHRSELLVTYAFYVHGSGLRRRLYSGGVSNTSGGISLSGSSLVEKYKSFDRSSAMTQAIRGELAGGIPADSWSGAGGLRFVAFAVDKPPEPAWSAPREAPILPPAQRVDDWNLWDFVDKLLMIPPFFLYVYVIGCGYVLIYSGIWIWAKLMPLLQARRGRSIKERLKGHSLDADTIYVDRNGAAETGARLRN